MRIHRGPRSTNDWHQTDNQPIGHRARDWKPGKTMEFSGTIDKSGDRHTVIGVEFDEQDIMALHNGLLAFQRKRIRELEQEVSRLEQEVSRFKTVLSKVHKLAQNSEDYAPNTDELLQGIKEIALHFWIDNAKPFKSRFHWLKWRSLK